MRKTKSAENPYSFIKYFLVSSKNNVNIDTLFVELARQLKAQYDTGNIVDNRSDSFHLKYPDTTTISSKWYKCCNF